MTATASVIGSIIPPSTLMIIYGYLTGLSTGQLFLGGAIPGVIVGISLMVTAHIQARRLGIGVDNEAPPRTVATFLAVLKDSGPAFLIPLVILGGIVGGFFTPNGGGGRRGRHRPPPRRLRVRRLHPGAPRAGRPQRRLHHRHGDACPEGAPARARGKPGGGDHRCLRRNIERAAMLAERFGGRPYASFESLLSDVDAVSFAVPAVRDVVGRARAAGATHGTGGFRSGALLGGPYAASAWRQERFCALWDAAPHRLSVLVAVLGSVREITSARQDDGGLALSLGHTGGGRSTLVVNLRDPSTELSESYRFTGGSELLALENLASTDRRSSGRRAAN